MDGQTVVIRPVLGFEDALICEPGVEYPDIVEAGQQGKVVFRIDRDYGYKDVLAKCGQCESGSRGKRILQRCVEIDKAVATKTTFQLPLSSSAMRKGLPSFVAINLYPCACEVNCKIAPAPSINSSLSM